MHTTHGFTAILKIFIFNKFFTYFIGLLYWFSEIPEQHTSEWPTMFKCSKNEVIISILEDKEALLGSLALTISNGEPGRENECFAMCMTNPSIGRIAKKLAVANW